MSNVSRLPIPRTPNCITNVDRRQQLPPIGHVLADLGLPQWKARIDQIAIKRQNKIPSNKASSVSPVLVIGTPSPSPAVPVLSSSPLGAQPHYPTFGSNPRRNYQAPPQLATISGISSLASGENLFHQVQSTAMMQYDKEMYQLAANALAIYNYVRHSSNNDPNGHPVIPSAGDLETLLATVNMMRMSLVRMRYVPELTQQYQPTVYVTQTENKSPKVPTVKGKRTFYRANNNNTCENCHTRQTPEWRRGPNGPQSLCNACGLAYAKLSKKKSPGSKSQANGFRGRTLPAKV